MVSSRLNSEVDDRSLPTNPWCHNLRNVPVDLPRDTRKVVRSKMKLIRGNLLLRAGSNDYPKMS